MGFIPNMLGLGDAPGSNFQASGAGGKPTSPIINPITGEQAQNAYGRSQQGLDLQRQFIQALQNQNGLGNQSSVFNQQQALANQLQGLANGTGPNPALAQLANTTGQNVANQAALMAGQRGANANVGLMARQIAQQGGQIQQNAAGQAAALQAQQQINAMNALQNQQAQMGNLANQQANQQANALMGYNQAAQGLQNSLLNGIANQNQANVSMQSNMNNANAGIQGGVMGQQGSMMGTLGGLGAAAMLMAKGGEVKKMAEGGPVSMAGQMLGGFAQPQMVSFGQPQQAPAMPYANQMQDSFNSTFGSAKQMAGRPKNTDNSDAAIADDIKLGLQSKATGGKVVPGKAKVGGDSLKNDTVPAMLSPGEVVLPRSVMQSSDPVASAAQFVEAIMKKKGRS